MIELRRVTRDEEVASVVQLAAQIWREHFTPIIGEAQVEYMLRTVQSHDAIAHQIRELGYEYDLIFVDANQVGYAAIVQTDEARFQLSKLYVLGAHRGVGVARAVVSKLEARSAARGATELWLTVNRHNADAIAFYKRVGFVVTGPIVTDIGEGFVMDDHRMAKSVATRPHG